MLLRKESTFKKPPGFSRSQDYGCFVLVPKLEPEHKLRMRSVPLAPSPLFSVEQVSGAAVFVAIAYIGNLIGKSTSVFNGFPTLGLRVELLEEMPSMAADAFSRISNNAFTYHWYRVKSSGVDFRLVICALVYQGLCLAKEAAECCRKMHIFSSDFISGLDFPTATKWYQDIKVIRTAEDW